jgi:hypothetical protein
LKFLLLETIRNEVVDDEVAMMIPSLQHSMKQVMSSNLWDECGNGNIDNFHTTSNTILAGPGLNTKGNIKPKNKRNYTED